MNSKMIFFFLFINYLLHACSKICKKNTRVCHLIERVIFAYFINFNNFLFIYDNFDFDRFFKFFHLVCRLVDQFDTTNIHSTSISMFHVSRIRWRNEIELKDESKNLKRKILKYEFYRTWNQKISKKKRRWHFVFDQKEHCVSDIFKIVVVETFNLKKKVMSWFQRKLSDLLFCQLVQN